MKKLALYSLILATFSLASCGGSSSGVSSDYVIPANLQNYLNTPTYVQGTDEYTAFYAINGFRNLMGLGYWQQNVHYDTAAANHMNYSILNANVITNPYQTDLEVSTNAGYTGLAPSNRVIYTGYYATINTATATNVQYAPTGELYWQGTGADMTSTSLSNSMVNTIYQRSGLMAQSTRYIGLARDTAGAATSATHWWLNHGRIDSGQYVASNYQAHYPLTAQTSVPLAMTYEYPSVYNSYTPAQFASSTSSPISFHVSASTILSVSSFKVVETASGSPLTGTTFTINNDPNLNSSNSASQDLTTTPTPTPTIPAYEAYWIGNTPFKPNTTYTATFIGSSYLSTVGLTTQINQSWNFTTGSGN